MRTSGYEINEKIKIISEKKIEKFLKNGLLKGNSKKFSISEK